MLRRYNNVGVFSTIVTLAIIIQISYQTTLNEKRVKIIDTFNFNQHNADSFNALFRSNQPINFEGEFDYDQLFKDLIDPAKYLSVHINEGHSEDYYLIIFSLLKKGCKTNKLEKQFFTENPDRGELRERPVVGVSSNPESFSEEEVKKRSQSLYWIGDPIDDIVDELYDTLTTKRDKNVLIVVHCEHGKDRTGEISGAYNLKYNYQTWEEVCATNFEIGGTNKHMEYNNQRALTWYCLYLANNFYNLTCTYENLSNGSKEKPELVGWDEPSNYYTYLILFYVLLSLVLVFCIAHVVWITRHCWSKWRIVRYIPDHLHRCKLYFEDNDCDDNASGDIENMEALCRNNDDNDEDGVSLTAANNHTVSGDDESTAF